MMITADQRPSNLAAMATHHSALMSSIKDCRCHFSSSPIHRSFWGSSSSSSSATGAKEEPKTSPAAAASSSGAAGSAESSKVEGDDSKLEEPQQIETAEELKAQLEGIKEAETKLKEQVGAMSS